MARETKYDIARQFSEGFSAALLPVPRLLSESDHWLCGWDAGYKLRKAKNRALNDYLASIGHESMAIITPASPRPEREG